MRTAWLGPLLLIVLASACVASERLQFPLARVPLEFTEGSAAGGGLLPTLFANRTFLA